MPAPPNPNRLMRRTLGEIKQAAQQIKDDAAFGAAVRSLLVAHDAAHQALIDELKQAEAQAIARKTGTP